MKQLYFFLLCFISVLCYSQDDYEEYVYENPNVCRSEENRLDSIVSVDLSIDEVTMDTIFEFDYKYIYSYRWDNPLLPERRDAIAADALPERDSYTYDDDGNLLTTKDEVYDETEMMWKLDFERANIYDENGNLVSWESFSYDFFDGELTSRSREERKFDDNGNLTESDRYNWDAELEEYYLDAHIDYFYNEFNVADSILFLSWDRENEVLDPWFRINYISEEDRWLSRVSAGWDEITQSYIPFSSREWTYDTDGFLTSVTSGRYINDEWVQTTRNEYDRDDCGDILVLRFFGFDQDVEDWVIRSINTYYYSGLSKIVEVKELSAAIYPNPSPNSIVISNDNLANGFHISIVDLSGITRSEQQVTQGEVIEISYLPAGFYNIMIQSDNKFYSTKLSKL